MTRREEQRGSPQPFRERNLLLRQASGKFENVPLPALERQGVYRGAAFGDIDNDGDTDIVVNANNGGAILLSNKSTVQAWLGVEAPRGSCVELKSAGMPTQTRCVRTDSSYLSASDPKVLFAIAGKIESLTVQSPGRAARRYTADQVGLKHVFRADMDNGPR